MDLQRPNCALSQLFPAIRHDLFVSFGVEVIGSFLLRLLEISNKLFELYCFDFSGAIRLNNRNFSFRLSSERGALQEGLESLGMPEVQS